MRVTQYPQARRRQARSRRLGHFALTVAASALVGGYGRPVQAGTCAPIGGGVVQCSGAADPLLDTAQVFLNPGDLVITTDPGFGLDTSAINGTLGFDIDAPDSVVFDGSAPGDVTSEADTIDVVGAQGDVEIDTTGLEITSVDGDAIEITGDLAPGDVTVTTGNITADEDGVRVQKAQAGDTVIDTTGGSILSFNADGVDFDGTDTGNVAITTADIEADFQGIEIDAERSGDVTVDTTAGAVVSQGREAIRSTVVESGDVAIATGDVTANLYTIDVEQTDSGMLEIDTTAGTVRSVIGDGVRAAILGSGASLITTGEILADNHGVYVDAEDSDAVEIDTTGGTVSADDNNGVSLYARGTDAQIATGDIEVGITGEFGVYASSEDTATLVVDTTGGQIDVTGDAGFNSGVGVETDGTDEVTVSTGEITSVANGVEVTSENFDTVLVDTTGGAVDTNSAFGVQTDIETGTRAAVRTGDVTSPNTALEVFAADVQEVEIDTTGGTLTSELADGVEVVLANTEIVDIKTGDIDARDQAIQIEALNGGQISLDTSQGTITGQEDPLGGEISGIELDLEGSDSVSVTTADVTGSFSALAVDSDAAAEDVEVNTTAGALLGLTDTGLDVAITGTPTVEVRTADVTGPVQGIQATFEDNADILLDTTAGVVTGTAASGIDVDAGPAQSLEVVTGDVTGGQIGVNIDSFDVDMVDVDTAQGQVVGTVQAGVDVAAQDASRVQVETGDVQSDFIGVQVLAEQAVTAQDADVTVDTRAGTVEGGQFGVQVTNLTNGAITVAVGDIAAIGTGLDLGGDGRAEIVVAGNVTGQVGLDTTDLADTNDQGVTVEITGQVTGTGGTAIVFGDARHDLVIFDALAPVDALAAIASTDRGIDGDTLFGASDDTLTFGGGAGTLGVFSGQFGGVFDGGDGIDTAFFDVALDALVDARLFGDILELDFGDPLLGDSTLIFSNFDLFSFDDPDVLLSAGDVIGQAGAGIAPVPLPPGAVLLGTGIGALLCWRRRRSGGQSPRP